MIFKLGSSSIWINFMLLGSSGTPLMTNNSVFQKREPFANNEAYRDGYQSERPSCALWVNQKCHKWRRAYLDLQNWENIVTVADNKTWCFLSLIFRIFNAMVVYDFNSRVWCTANDDSSSNKSSTRIYNFMSQNMRNKSVIGLNRKGRNRSRAIIKLNCVDWLRYLAIYREKWRAVIDLLPLIANFCFPLFSWWTWNHQIGASLTF